MSQNNLLDVVNFMKENNTFSDYNFINDFMSSLNFTKYRFNNDGQKGGKELNYQKKIIGGSTPSIPLSMNLPINTQGQMITSMDNQMIPPMDNQIIPPMDNQMIPPMNNQMFPPMDNQIIPPMDNQMIPTMDNQSILLMNSQSQNIQSLEQVPIEQTTIPEIEELNKEINEFGNSELTVGINDNADCVYKKIKNLDGTYITQKICGQTIVTMPDMFLPKPTFMYSGTNTYIIKKGTILYHATIHKRGFNTKEIRLGKDKLISFFTPNFRLASDKIEGCSIDKQKGFIHVFEVKTDISDIFIKLPYDTDEDLNLDELKDKFCNGNEYYKGVGFFYPKNEIELFNNSIFNQRTEEIHENLDEDSYYSEFALCSPNDYLTYLYSQKCMSLRKLSQPYRFDGKNYN